MGIFDFFKNKNKKETVLPKEIDALLAGVDEELSYVKNNSDEHIITDEYSVWMSLTVSCWLLIIEENEDEKTLPIRYVIKFCRLFLEEEKRRKHIKDFSKFDVRAVQTLTLIRSISEVMKLIESINWDYAKAKEFEKTIGYNKLEN